MRSSVRDIPDELIAGYPTGSNGVALMRGIGFQPLPRRPTRTGLLRRFIAEARRRREEIGMTLTPAHPVNQSLYLCVSDRFSTRTSLVVFSVVYRESAKGLKREKSKTLGWPSAGPVGGRLVDSSDRCPHHLCFRVFAIVIVRPRLVFGRESATRAGYAATDPLGEGLVHGPGQPRRFLQSARPKRLWGVSCRRYNLPCRLEFCG
jgi:hypothetical protein